MANRGSCHCVPLTDGFYWATHPGYGWRSIVLLTRDGHKHRRAFRPRGSSSYDPCDLVNYSRKLRDPLEAK
jgi:hypothetical protein